MSGALFTAFLRKLGVQRYGWKIGRLWLRAEFVPRDLWVGIYVKEPYWEMAQLHQVVYVCVVPTLPILLDWTRRS